jgi:chromosomal replication initiator protein
LELPVHLEPPSAWREIRAEIRRVVGESTYEIWIAPLEVESLKEGLLIHSAPAATRAWVAKRFGRLLEATAKGVLQQDVRVAFATRALGGGGGTDAAARASGTTAATAGDELSDTVPASLNPRYRFDQFIIADGNRLAHAAALAVAELPGQAYNPLFLYAPPGLGKTHLLQAIGNYVKAFGGGTTVRYATVEAFTNHFISALGSRSLERFKRCYRGADVLLIDDVQFLASKAKTEEEFFHTFNALYENGRQLVVTCDRLPRQLVTVEERLRERFEAGLVAEIEPPDHAARVAILRKRAQLDRIHLDDDSVLDLIADRVTDNVRQLEGALIRVVAYHSLARRPIDRNLTRKVLDTMYPSTAKAPLSIEDVQAKVASRYGITVAELVSPSRAARIAWPRHIALHLARELTGASLQDIGRAFGGRNHATVLHACKTVAKRVKNDQQVQREIDELGNELRAGEADRSC